MMTNIPRMQGPPAAPADDRAQIAAILARQEPGPAQRRYGRGFSFHPVRGHALTLPPEAEPLLAIADRLEIKLAGGSALAFVVAARLHERRGGWSSPWYLHVYAWHRDRTKGRPLNAEAWQLPESARRLDVVVADDRGMAVVTRRCMLPPTLAGSINARIRRVDGCDHRAGHLEGVMELLGRTVDAGDIGRLSTHEHALVDLDELPPPAAGV